MRADFELKRSEMKTHILI